MNYAIHPLFAGTSVLDSSPGTVNYLMARSNVPLVTASVPELPRELMSVPLNVPCTWVLVIDVITTVVK